MFWGRRRELSDRRLMFCISSGRSGSGYLAELLGTADEVASFHEPEPTMTGAFLHMINRFPYAETRKKRRIKTRAIKKAVRALPPGHVYCETSHMFIKTFFDVVMEEFRNVDVIVLRREVGLVLKSFIELGYFSSRNTAWPAWMSSPNAKTAALQCIGRDDQLDQYDLCISYLFDIEARALRFEREYDWVRTHSCQLESLNSYSRVEAFFKDLLITPTERTKRLVGQAVNTREKKKEHYNNPADLDYCRSRINAYVEKATSLGIALPATLTLKPHTPNAVKQVESAKE